MKITTFDIRYKYKELGIVLELIVWVIFASGRLTRFYGFGLSLFFFLSSCQIDVKCSIHHLPQPRKTRLIAQMKFMVAFDSTLSRRYSISIKF